MVNVVSADRFQADAHPFTPAPRPQPNRGPQVARTHRFGTTSTPRAAHRGAGTQAFEPPRPRRRRLLYFAHSAAAAAAAAPERGETPYMSYMTFEAWVGGGSRGGHA